MLTVGDKAPSSDADLDIALMRGPVALFFLVKAFGADCTVEALEFNSLLAVNGFRPRFSAHPWTPWILTGGFERSTVVNA